MQLAQKLEILADAAKYDASCASSGGKRKRPENGIGNAEGVGICHSYAPDGRCISLLKLLLTNYCIYDCSYCVNRLTSSTPRARFSTEEVVNLTLDFYRRNYIEGLFLSSGIIQSPDYTMEQLIAVARSLRETHLFGGYIHLKTVPGVSPELLAQAGSYADRLSVNIELPLAKDLSTLAPAKSLPVIEKTMGQIKAQIVEHKENKTKSFAAAGQSTQMIVGATSAPDTALLSKASQLYKQFSLRRVYYSAFSPIPDSDPALPQLKIPLIREHRLYQADWLMRFYGFRADEIATQADGNLSLERDPKLEWALAHREQFPVDVNKAPYAMLLRVPGFGVRTVQHLVIIRRHQSIRWMDLEKLGVRMKKAGYFIQTADDHRLAMSLDGLALIDRFRQPEQLSLFEASTSAKTGHL